MFLHTVSYCKCYMYVATLSHCKCYREKKREHADEHEFNVVPHAGEIQSSQLANPVRRTGSGRLG